MPDHEKNKPEEEREGDDGTAFPVSAVVGTAVAVANSKPISALLTPTFAAIGNDWGQQTQERIDRRNAKRRENLLGHVDAVRRLKPELEVDDPPTESAERFAQEWGEGAQSVDPQREADLAALWQGLLGSIYDGDDVELQIVTLKKMTSTDARMLLNFRDHRADLERDQIERLRALGLIELRPFIDTHRHLLVQATLLATVTFLVYNAADLSAVLVPAGMLSSSDIDQISRVAHLLAPFLLLVVAATAGIAILSSLARSSALAKRARLTTLGRRLRESASTYRRSSVPYTGEDRDKGLAH